MQDPSTIQRNEDASMDYATFVNIVGKKKVEKFRRMNDIISQENNEEFFTLFHLWEYFQENRDHTMTLSDESRISMGTDCGKACHQPSTSTEGILKTTELTPNETAIFTADQFGTVQNNSLNSHKNGDDHGSCSEMQLQPPCYYMHHLLYSGDLSCISPLVFSAWWNA